MKRAAFEAYAEHLEPFHNWLLKNTFQAAIVGSAMLVGRAMLVGSVMLVGSAILRVALDWPLTHCLPDRAQRPTTLPPLTTHTTALTWHSPSHAPPAGGAQARAEQARVPAAARAPRGRGGHRGRAARPRGGRQTDHRHPAYALPRARPGGHAQGLSSAPRCAATHTCVRGGRNMFIAAVRVNKVKQLFSQSVRSGQQVAPGRQHSARLQTQPTRRARFSLARHHGHKAGW